MVNLLICMARAAVNNSRNAIIFDPYPTVVDPDDSKQLALDPKVQINESVLHTYILTAWHQNFRLLLYLIFRRDKILNKIPFYPFRDHSTLS